MKICITVLYYDPSLTQVTPKRYLERVPMLLHLPHSLASLGHKVDVVQLYPQEAEFTESEVNYHFVHPGWTERRLAKAMASLIGRQWSRGLMATRAASLVRRLRPDVIHFHGLVLTSSLFWLLLRLGRSGPPVVGQYHGGYPSHNRILRGAQAFNFRRLAAALFTAQEHADPFVLRGILERQHVVELVEVSSSFRWESRMDARLKTGMKGSPIFLWTGRLHPIKDPITALKGFQRILASWPEAQLYLHYLSAELFQQLRLFAAARPELDDHVHFQGRAPHKQMEAIYNSADFLLQASEREYAGYAVLEAMACGVIPVVTDIPAFRALTDGGLYGILFKKKDADELAQRVLALDSVEIPAFSESVRERFRRDLSYEAKAAQLTALYENCLSKEVEI